MQSIPFYISYLLTKHECVIVPDLGAFVVSSLDKETKRWDILSPPEKSLEFIAEINNNDGLLTYCITKAEKCSSEEAELIISQFVNEAFASFEQGKSVDIPCVGSLYYKDDKILFRPERILSCNSQNYGLEGFTMPRHEDVMQEEVTSNMKSKRKKHSTPPPDKRKYIYIACAIAIVLLFVLIVLSILLSPLEFKNRNSSDTSDIESVSEHKSQDIAPEDVNISKDTIQMQGKPSEIQAIDATIQVREEVKDSEKVVSLESQTTVVIPEKESSTPDNEKVIIAEKVSSTSNQEVATINEKAKKVKTNNNYYYNVVASYTTLRTAKASLSLFHSKGFKNAGILEFPGRFRIYTHRFENREEAEKFNIEFRMTNPEHSDAYVLKN